MPVTFQLSSDRPLDQVGFAWSPLFEAMLSMRVAVSPKRTPIHLPWTRRFRQLPADLVEEVELLIGAFGSYVPGIFEVGLRGASPRFEDELADFRALDADLVGYELTLALGGVECGSYDEGGPAQLRDPEYREMLLTQVDPDEQRVALVRLALDEPAALQERYASMLERYWTEAFAEEWERILPRLEAEVTDGSRALVGGGAGGLVAELLPEGRWDPEAKTIVVDKDWDGTCDVGGRGGLLMVPTVYGWPCVMIELFAPWPAAIIFPLRELRQPAVPHASDREVVDGFRALGDETRLQIARMVAEHPRSTKELAELLSLSDSAISRHLKILDAAGLVASRRDGYFVLYELCPDRLDVLGGALRATLGLAQARTGAVPALPVTVGRAAR